MSADEKEAAKPQSEEDQVEETAAPAAQSSGESADQPGGGPDEPEIADEASIAEQEEADDDDDDLPPIQCQVDDLGALRRKLTITIPPERIAARRDESISEMSSKVQVPGFRIGRAPRRLLEKRFGSELADDIKATMIAQGVEKALKQTELKVLGEPDMDIEKVRAITLPESGPMTFDITVEVQPEFELPELEGIPVTRHSTVITDQDLEAELARWQANLATLETVDEPARPDDVLTADVTFQPEGGQMREHLGAQVPVRAQAIEGVPLEDLGEKLTGAEPGRTVVVEASVPQGHPDEELRGKKVALTFVVKHVRRIRMPELDRQLAGRFGFEELDELRNWMRERMEMRAGENVTVNMRQQVRNYLLEHVELELPEGVLARMQERALTRRANELMMQGVPRSEVDKHIDALAVHAGQEAALELKTLFIMQRVAQDLQVQVSQQEVNALVAQMAAHYNRRPDSLRDELERRKAMGSLHQQILEQKALDMLLERANITDAEAPPQPDAAAGNEGGEPPEKS